MTCTTVDRELLLYVLERCRASFVQQGYSYASHDLARKNANEALRFAGKVWAKQHTYHFFELKLIYNVQPV